MSCSVYWSNKQSLKLRSMQKRTRNKYGRLSHLHVSQQFDSKNNNRNYRKTFRIFWMREKLR